MIRNIIIITIFISFVLRSVTSDKAWDRIDIERAPRHHYKYNRPVDEIYASIPVAVVYEDKDIREEKYLKNEHTRTGKTKSIVIDPDLKDIDNISVPSSKNVKDEVVDTTSKFKSNIDTNDTKIMDNNTKTEITTMKDTDDIFVNISANTYKDQKDTNTGEVASKSESDNFSEGHGNVTNTNDKTDTMNKKLADHTRSSPKIDKNIKLLSQYSTKEVHIPVVIVYDTDKDPTKNNKDQIFATSPKTQVPKNFTSRTETDKDNKQSQQQKGFILRALSFNEDKVETTSYHKPEPQENNEEVLQSKKHTSFLSKMEKVSVTPQKQNTTIVPQNEQNTESSQKEFKSRTTGETVQSANKNSTKAGKKRRQRDPVVPIINSKNEIYSQTGEFRYSYEGGDGTKAFSKGELKTFDDDKTGEAVVGSFSYKDKEGNDFSLSYTADENGYRPVGEHLPTSPPIPPAIARALRYLATKTTPEPVTKPQTS